MLIVSNGARHLFGTRSFGHPAKMDVIDSIGQLQPHTFLEALTHSQDVMLSNGLSTCHFRVAVYLATLPPYVSWADG